MMDSALLSFAEMDDEAPSMETSARTANDVRWLHVHSMVPSSLLTVVQPSVIHSSTDASYLRVRVCW
jgi:hypothetical protein